MNLNEAAENAYKSALQRQHNGADVKVAEILKHCAGEVIEAQEPFIECCKYFTMTVLEKQRRAYFQKINSLPIDDRGRGGKKK